MSARKEHRTEEVKKDKIQLRLKAFDYRLLDKSVKDIIQTVKRVGASMVGPIPLPTKIDKFTILKSPHVNKDARDQLEMRTHSRLLYILQPDHIIIDALMKLNLASGIEIQIKIDGE